MYISSKLYLICGKMYSDFFLSKISSKQKIEENVNQLLELVRTHLLNEVELELIFFFSRY